MPKLRVHNLALSLDGYVAGPNQGGQLLIASYGRAVAVPVPA